MKKRISFSSGTPWENAVGFSRAVRIGNVIEVSGTTAMEGDKIIGPGDEEIQTRFILQKIQAVLKNAGASLDDIIRTRIFVTDISKWEIVGKVHGEFLGSVKPATTMVEVKALIHPALTVEIEATAIINH